jgi:hypothetical protein
MRGEAVINDRVLSEPPKDARPTVRFGKAVTRYWPEVVVVALAVVLWVPRLTGPIDLRWDAGVYYVLGSSLATGQGYRILSEPGSPEALQYPPLLPAIVALYQRALGSTAPAVIGPWLRLSYAALFFCYGLAVLALARRYLRPTYALLATALCLLQIWTIFLSDLLFAELPFALVSVVFALAVVRGGSPRLQQPWQRELLAFALATAGFLLRSAGVVLFAAWIIEAVARKSWRLALARAVLALLPVFLWQMHVERVRRSDEYRHPAYAYQRAPYQNYNVTYLENILLRDPFKPEEGMADKRVLASRVLSNVAKIPAYLGQAVSAPVQLRRSTLQFRPFSQIRVPISVVLAPILALGMCVLAGFVFLIRRGAWILVSIGLLSMSLICLTPWPEEFNRYLAPVAPFLAISAVVTVQSLAAAFARRQIRWGQLALAGLLGLALIVQTHAAVRFFYTGGLLTKSTYDPRAAGAHFFHERDWLAWEQAVAWIAAHAAPGDVVATAAPHQLYLRTGLRAVYPPFDADAVHARYQIEAVPVRYVIVDEFKYRDFSLRYSLPAVQSDPSSWRLVYTIERTRVYQRTTRS